MVTYQASHSDERTLQLQKIMRLRPKLNRNPEKAMKELLWEKYDSELGGSGS